MKPLFLAGLLLALPALAADADLAALAGTYHGRVFNGSGLAPITTTFAVLDGRLVGDYVVDDPTGAFEGRLSNVQLEDGSTLTMEWTDKYGEGYVELQFTPGFRQLEGFWGTYDSDDQFPWSVTKD